MTRVSSIITKHPRLGWCGLLLVFIGAGFLGAAAMRLLLERYEFLFSLSGALLVSLGGGFFAWVAFHTWRRLHPLLCAAAMGLFSGIAGGGVAVLLGSVLTLLTPAGGITSTIR